MVGLRLAGPSHKVSKLTDRLHGCASVRVILFPFEMELQDSTQARSAIGFEGEQITITQRAAV